MLFSVFENVLDAHLSSSRQVVLALSGGIDSRVLLDLLSTYRDVHPQHRYLVIHIHHGLSPHADSWMTQCGEWASDVGIPFKGVKVRVENNGEGIEKAARTARYQGIEDNVEPNALILTGQHADDQAETFLLALKRGSGPAGLSAMPALRPMGQAFLLRPLLSVTRRDIEAYAEQRGLSWVEDESNIDCKFDRNFIRQHWLPPAQSRWPGLVKAINRTASLCAEQEALLEELLQEHDAIVCPDSMVISLHALNGYSAKMQSALVRRWLKQTTGLSASQAQLSMLFSSVIAASDDANPKLYLGGWQVRRFQSQLHAVPEYEDISDWRASLKRGVFIELPNECGQLGIFDAENAFKFDNFDAQGNRVSVQLRKPKLDEKVSIRFDPEGVLAHPLGRQGKRKLKKLYQEYGVPSWMRRRTPLLYFGETVAAVAGLFVCEGFEGQDCDFVWHKTH
ncbi:tRNA lysidine(34) synthetase TilS [Enterovibrio norvegicus]|uniref:tRNA lysidine(34) synthetase TilS n=1 Tax=Enterovibrio norvegicus TaxID=188144 RepID=UPI000C81FA5D|nr:tRNA lysidine(34) synthetase TilS [Enterovibrio norvegicus]PML79547.1 tRNA lysidine(34) synthetase TilS [Enterovibrio norvegicus]